MYAISVGRILSRSFSARVKTVVSSLKCIQRNYKAKPTSSIDSKSQLKSDVVIFRLEHMKYFVRINILSAVQCAFWSYVGFFFFKYIESPVFKFDEDKFWAKVLEKERQYSPVLCAFSIFFGWAVLLGTLFYTSRSIRKIILHRDGKYITLVTYNLPGYNVTKVPLNNLCSGEQRKKAKKYIPLKIKGRPFYYLIDVRGEFSDPYLFDNTVGARRGL